MKIYYDKKRNSNILQESCDFLRAKKFFWTPCMSTLKIGRTKNDLFSNNYSQKLIHYVSYLIQTITLANSVLLPL